jgi:hypothetical protein
MKKARWVALLILLVSATPALAQEYFYNNGLFVGIGAQADFYQRREGINYGFPHFCQVTPICDPQVFGFSPTHLNDVAPSPTFTLGFKFNDDDAVTFKGDWAQFSVSRNLTADTTTGFVSVAVDGFNTLNIPPAGPLGGPTTPTNIGLNWDSNLANAILEYQRRLTHGDNGGIFGLLGFKFRFESQTFHAKAINKSLIGTDVADNYQDFLREFLFGPYGGLKLSLKPGGKDSKWTFNVGGNIGWYFQNAYFKADNRFFNQGPFKAVDHSKKGTLFAGANLDLIYAINRNWFVDMGYEFNWVQAAAHIFNTHKTPASLTAAVPSHITDTSVITNAPGVKVIYKFN